MKLKALTTNCLAIGFLIILHSCQNATTQYQTGKTTFFDVKTYFKTEIERLQRDVRQVKKTVIVNGKAEEKTLDNVVFADELAPFVNSDINRPAWLDQYNALKINGDQRYELKKDKQLKTKLLSVHFADEAERPLPEKNGISFVNSIYVLNSESSAVTDYTQELKYNALEGYSIESRQKTALSGEEAVVVKVTFLKN